MYIAAFVFVPLAALEPALGSDFSPLPLDLTAVVPPRSRRKPPNFPVWLTSLSPADNAWQIPRILEG